MKKEHCYIIPALLISLFIYLFYRTQHTVVNELAIRLLSSETYLTLRNTIVQHLPLSDIIVYSLPEGLWIFCITLTSMPYYLQMGSLYVDCKYMPLIYCVGLELLQLTHITNGRFDFIDIAFSAAFWLLAMYAFRQRRRQNILSSIDVSTMGCLTSYGIVYLSHVIK